MKTETLFSSKSDEWETPQEVFDVLNEEFHFNLDPCATEGNHKCERFFTLKENGLLQSWGGVKSSAIHRILRLANGWQKLSTSRG